MRCVVSVVGRGSARFDMWPGVRTESSLTYRRKRQQHLRYDEQADQR